MENKTQIVFIDADKLHPHEDNPRKNIGDVSELADSIKTNGILQNLTVVPATGHWHGDYTVIIGHRRLAAGKIAGVKKFPCVIREMTQKEQIATMLLENMQRNDLTIYEQAQGMQMMLDLGETVESVAEQTGFSVSTVRRRVRLAELDADKFKKAEGRQINLTEYDKLFEVEDKETRNKLLDEIGTSNFVWAVKNAVAEEKSKKRQMEIIKKLQPYAEETTADVINGLKFVASFNSEEYIPEDMQKHTYYYRPAHGSWVQLYREYTDEEKAELDKSMSEAEERRAERSERMERFDALFKQAFDMRVEFARNLTNFKGKEDIICEMAINAILTQGKSWRDEISYDVFNEIMGTEFEERFSFTEISTVTDMKIKTLFAIAYSVFEDKNEDCYDGNLRYHESDNLNTVYDYLRGLGYEMSDEEQALLDGTHELYIKDTEEEQT